MITALSLNISTLATGPAKDWKYNFRFLASLGRSLTLTFRHKPVGAVAMAFAGGWWAASSGPGKNT